MAADQFLDEIGNDDQVAIWTYGDNVKEICGFSRGHDAPREALFNLRAPSFSELNFYDALVETLQRMQGVQVLTGRRALLVISSGLDTFSKATYQDAVQAAEQSGVPIYAIDLVPVIRTRATLSSNTVPYAHLDWPRAESGLQRIAQASAGRMYAPPATLELAGVYDDLMENLRVRYVITYKSTADPDMNGPRTVRIELIDSRTGGPLRIVDASGRLVRSKLLVEGSYVPPTRRPAPKLQQPGVAVTRRIDACQGAHGLGRARVAAGTYAATHGGTVSTELLHSPSAAICGLTLLFAGSVASSGRTSGFQWGSRRPHRFCPNRASAPGPGERLDPEDTRKLERSQILSGYPGSTSYRRSPAASGSAAGGWRTDLVVCG